MNESSQTPDSEQKVSESKIHQPKIPGAILGSELVATSDSIKKLFTWENAIPLIFTILVGGTTAFYKLSLNTHANGLVWTVIAILLAAVLSVYVVRAGVLVIRSLIEVNVGLTLIVFLSQSYCSSGRTSATGDQALSNLIVIALFYILYIFFRGLWKSVKEEYAKTKQERWSFRSVVAILLLLFFVGTFVAEIYRIVDPIIEGLCIYK